MINNVRLNNNYNIQYQKIRQNSPVVGFRGKEIKNNHTAPIGKSVISPVNTTLSESDKVKYTYLLNLLKDCPISPNSENISPKAQLDILLKNGRLLSTKSNDKSSTLDNLYKIATEPRAYNLDKKKILTDTLDILVNPRHSNQKFGDIPLNEKKEILAKTGDKEIKENPSMMNVTNSGVCPAAAMGAATMAHRRPAEYARWVEGLSGINKAVYSDIDTDSISKNLLEASDILKLLDANHTKFDLKKMKFKIQADENAYIRAKIQSNNWDMMERNIPEVLIQGAIMNTGSQNTYNSLTDIRKGEFSSNPQGLIELEKTYMETLIRNEEITSLIYQKIDDDQNIIGYNCSFNDMAKHITRAIDSGDDVVVGLVDTNESSGRTKSSSYNPKTDGKPNKIINGHEIAIVDYKKTSNGKIQFICIDTDDDTNDFVVYDSDVILPKLHHAGYAAKIVKDDAQRILNNMNVA